ncbi:MAG: pilus assembly protein [Burkholderiales bacterium]|nr:pilus assembly protein [Burkholderiales bacterium]
MNTRASKQYRSERGAATVEMALVATLFFTLLFGVIELGRAMYIWNTVQHITRQAARDATVTDFTNTAAMDAVRQNAIFRTDAGSLIAGAEITDASVRISYFSMDSGGVLHEVAPTSTCPPKVVFDCNNNPNGSGCIRFVQAQLCDPGSSKTCNAVKYQSTLLGGFIPGFANIPLPRSPVLMPAENLGFRSLTEAC